MDRQQRLMSFNNAVNVGCYQDASKANLQARKPCDIKRCDSLQQAVRCGGLQDGMTISFHHVIRSGDLALNQVMETLASSSLSDCHAPLVGHIHHDVVSCIYISGLRGSLADAISPGLLEEPVQLNSYGGRVNLIKSGELKIDVAFLAMSACDEFSNANGYSGEACGSIGYARVDAEAAEKVVTEQILPYPHHPASLAQDRVDSIDILVTEHGIAVSPARRAGTAVTASLAVGGEHRLATSMCATTDR